MPPTLSIVCPVYNEQDNIRPFYDALVAVLDGELRDFSAEIIYANDGSRDDSLARLKALAAADPRVKVLNFSRNFGHQAALTAGLERATGDVIVTMDSDLQDPPRCSPSWSSNGAPATRSSTPAAPNAWTPPSKKSPPTSTTA